MSQREDRDFLWKERSKTLLISSPVFSVYSALRTSPSGKEVERYFLSARNWVTVIPLLEEEGERSCILVRQYRQGIQKVTWEFPAGRIDAGEEPHVTAGRELREETGCTASELILLGSVHPNPAILDNTQYVFVATGVTEAGSQNLDEHEDLDFRRFPLHEVRQNMGTGALCNGTMLSALGFLNRWLEAND